MRGRMLNLRFSRAFLISCWLLFEICSPSAALSASPAELISNFRVSQGLGRVTMDPTLNRIAQEQATAMAARDLLDHGAAGSFSSRIASSGSRHAAENIAYGYASFTKTLDQWINSSGHRKNLLMPGGRGLVSRAQKVRPLAALIGHWSSLRSMISPSEPHQRQCQRRRAAAGPRNLVE